MKLSILKNNRLLWIDLSKKWAEVIDINDNDARKLQAKTHDFDVKTKKLIEIPQPKAEPILEPTEEQIKEQKIKKAEELVLRKLVLQELQQDTKEIESKIKKIRID